MTSLQAWNDQCLDYLVFAVRTCIHDRTTSDAMYNSLTCPSGSVSSLNHDVTIFQIESTAKMSVAFLHALLVAAHL